MYWMCVFVKPQRCDCMLVAGTSATVYPAAWFPMQVRERGGHLIEVNLYESELTPLCTVSLRGKAGDILPQLVAAVRTLQAPLRALSQGKHGSTATDHHSCRGAYVAVSFGSPPSTTMARPVSTRCSMWACTEFAAGYHRRLSYPAYMSGTKSAIRCGPRRRYARICASRSSRWAMNDCT